MVFIRFSINSSSLISFGQLRPKFVIANLVKAGAGMSKRLRKGYMEIILERSKASRAKPSVGIAGLRRMNIVV